MYFPDFYQGKTEEEIAVEVRKEGFDPVKFQDPPGRAYQEHQHPETKLLAFLEGLMEVRVGDESYECKAGDKVLIPGNTPHAAVVGEDGCVFFWSEKLVP